MLNWDSLSFVHLNSLHSSETKLECLFTVLIKFPRKTGNYDNMLTNLNTNGGTDCHGYSDQYFSRTFSKIGNLIRNLSIFHFEIPSKLLDSFLNSLRVSSLDFYRNSYFSVLNFQFLKEFLFSQVSIHRYLRQ